MVCPPVVDKMSLELMLVGAGDSRVVEASPGDGDGDELELGDVGVGEPLSSSLLLVVDESSVVESSPPPGPSLSSSEDDSCLRTFRPIYGVVSHSECNVSLIIRWSVLLLDKCCSAIVTVPKISPSGLPQ